MGDDAVVLLGQFKIHHPMQRVIDMPDDSLFCANPLGAKLGKAVFLWSQTLQWPQDDVGASCDHDNAIMCTWGISLLELLFNFIIVTGMYFPVRVSGVAGQSTFVDYHSIEASLLPPGKRSAGVQIQSLQGCVASLSSLLQVQLFPSYVKRGSTSLHRLNFPSHIQGFSRRPMLLQQENTLNAVYSYIKILGASKSAFAPIQSFDVSPVIDVQWIADEPCTADRHRNYSRLMMRKRRN